MIGTKAEIGIILLAFSIFAFFLVFSVVVPSFFNVSVFSGVLSEFKWLAILYGPLSVLTIAGLGFYIVGRKKFLNRMNKLRIIPISSLFLGSFLLAFGLLASLSTYFTIQYITIKLGPFGTTFGDVFITYSPSFFYFALWAISGIILIIDSGKNLSVKN